MEFDCCVCLQNKKHRRGACDIFEPWRPAFLNSSTTIAAKLSKLANVDLNVFKVDNNRNLLCAACTRDLKIVLQFIHNVQHSAKLFKERLCSSHTGGESNTVTVKEEIDEFEENPLYDEILENRGMNVKDEDHTNEQLSLLSGAGDQMLIDFADTSIDQDPLDMEMQDSKYSNVIHQENNYSDTIIEEHEKNLTVPINVATETGNILCGCANDCTTKLSKRQFKNITAYYKSLKNIEDQKSFVKDITTQVLEQKQLNKGTPKSIGYIYFLPKSLNKVNTEKVTVCSETFRSTIPFNGNIDDIWKEQDNLKPKNKSRKINTSVQGGDTIMSVCDHFKTLQRQKLIRLKRAGVSKKSVEKLTYGKMFKFYKEWFKSTNYTKKVNTLKEYKQVLIENIKMDQILTLQRCGSKSVSRKQLLVIDKNKEDLIEKKVLDSNLASIKQEDPSETYSEFDDNHFNLKDDGSVQDSSEGRESVISNFSDDFKEEKQTRQGDVSSDIKKDHTKSCSDSETSDEDDNSILHVGDIRQESTPQRATRSSLPGGIIQDLIIKHNFGENITELLTEKKRQVTRNCSTIRKYCKLRGLPYMSDSGKMIPKKTLQPPCNCKKYGCTDKIPENLRKAIMNHYYSLGDAKKQAAFIVKLTERKRNASMDKKREFTLKFYLPLTTNMDSSAIKTRVCLTMFVNTLACVRKRPIDAWAKFDKDPTLSGNLTKQEIEKIAEKYKITSKNAVHTIPEVKTNEIDFVYRAMPFEEFMAHFSTKKDAVTVAPDAEYPLGSSSGSLKKKKDTRFTNRLKRLHGERHVRRDGTICGKKVIRPPCDCIKRNCTAKISEEQRQYIFNYYWSLGDVAKQRAFVIRFTRSISMKYSRKITDRTITMEYFLPLTKDFDGEKVQVCIMMFINTLAVNKTLVPRLWRKYAQGMTFTERRGIHARLSNESEATHQDVIASVNSHIDSLLDDDIELKAFKFNVSGVRVLKYKKMFRLYEQWFDASKYSKKANRAKIYRIVLLRRFFPDGKYNIKQRPTK